MKIYKYFLLHNKKLKPWIKYWLYIKSKDKNYVLSDILQGTSFYLENSSNKNFNLFQINGNSMQDGTPTPTNPVEIKSAGDNGFINEVISNKNLFNIPNNTVTASGLTATIENGIVSLGGTSTATSFLFLIRNKLSLKAGTYTISAFNDNASSDDTTDLRVTHRNGDGVIARAYLNTTNASLTFTLNTDLEEGCLQIRSGSGNTFNNFVIKPQLELGSTATSFVPHQEQNISIPCQQPMRSIGNVRDVFVKENGVRYEKHNIGVIESYNGETITTNFMSTTGELSTGAFVQYVLDTPNYIQCTQEQIEALESIIRAHTYEPITNINSTDETPAYLKIRYYMEV